MDVPIINSAQLLGNNLTGDQSQKQSLKSQPIFKGIINKKVGPMYYKQRQMLIFADPPKIEYYCPQTGVKKGEIPLII